MNHKPDYQTITEVHQMIDRLYDWIRHHGQPQAYSAPAEGLDEMAARMAKIAGDHMVREAIRG